MVPVLLAQFEENQVELVGVVEERHGPEVTLWRWAR
jgi:hypothetical protein